MSKQDQESAESAPTPKGPGSKLQTARIEQGITIDEIARQMNLNKKILESLEEDQYDDLQSPIFIRGYLRTYSRLVGLDEEETIQSFSAVYKKGDPEIRSIRSTNPEISSNDVRVKWVTYLVVIGLVVLISMWWVNSHQQDNNNANSIEPVSSISEAKEKTLIEPESESVSLPSDAVVAKEPTIEPEQTQVEEVGLVESTLEEHPLENEISVPQSSDIAVQETALDQNIEVANVLNEDANETPLKKEETATDESLVEEPVSSQQLEIVKKAEKGNDVLVIKVNATSWADISDANSQKLIKDLLKQNQTYRFVGKKPFKVFLGNGYGVEMTLNDKTQNFSKYIKANNTARFELGS